MNLYVKVGIMVAASTLLLSIIGGMLFDTVEAGERGIGIEYGKVNPNLYKEGFHVHSPIMDIHRFSVRQVTRNIKVNITTGDLQEVKASIAITYRVPDDSVINIYTNYSGDAWSNLVMPRTLEAVQSATGHYKAGELITKREEVKDKAKQLLEVSLGGLVDVTEIAITNTQFDKSYQQAIRDKQVASENVQKAKHRLEEARLNAEAARVAGTAITEKPMLLKQRELEIEMEKAKRWKGNVPQSVTVIGNDKHIIYGINK